MLEESEITVRNHFLGEIETEITGRQYHDAQLSPGEQVNLEREPQNQHDRNAIRVENGLSQTVGYLPRQLSAWLAPLVDQRKVHLDGYVPWSSGERQPALPDPCPLVLMAFQDEEGRQILEKAEPTDEREALHQVVLRAYEEAQGFRGPDLILGLAKGLRPLGKNGLLPETRLLLALLPGIAREARTSQGMRAMVKFRELLGTLTIGEPSHHHNLTFFPLAWPQEHKPAYTLLGKAFAKGLAVVEEVSESGSVPHLTVTNRGKRPLLIPEGETLMGAKQNQVINSTILVAAGKKFVLPVSCVGQGRRPHQSKHLESKFCAPPLLRHKTLKAIQRNRSERGIAASDQGEVWDEVQACLSETAFHSETTSLTDALEAAEAKLKEHCKRLVLPKRAAGVLVGHGDRIIGMDLFDSPRTLKSLWDRLSDAYFWDALRNPAAATPTPVERAKEFVERLSGAAKPRVPVLGLGEELEIRGDRLVGAALMYHGQTCHLAAFSN